MQTAPNERTSGNGAVALWFHAQRLRRAVPECKCSAQEVIHLQDRRSGQDHTK